MRENTKKISGFVLLIVLAVLVFWIGISLLGYLSSASDNIKAVSITALVSIVLYVSGRYAE